MRARWWVRGFVCIMHFPRGRVILRSNENFKSLQKLIAQWKRKVIESASTVPQKNHSVLKRGSQEWTKEQNAVT